MDLWRGEDLMRADDHRCEFEIALSNKNSAPLLVSSKALVFGLAIVTNHHRPTSTARERSPRCHACLPNCSVKQRRQG
jgi:hypothetical protein